MKPPKRALLHPIRLALLASSVLGGAALAWFWLEPSMERNAFLFGLSFGRLIAGAVIGLGSALLAWMALGPPRWLHPEMTSWKPGGGKRAGHMLGATAAICTFVVCSAGMLLLLAAGPVQAEVPYTLSVILARTLPLLIWALVSSFMVLIALVLTIGPNNLSATVFDPGALLPALALLMLMVTAVVAMILAIEPEAFFLIDGWFWDPRRAEVDARFLAAAAGLFLLAIGGALALHRTQDNEWVRPALILVTLAVLIQLLVGLARAPGLEGLRLKYLSSGTSTFLRDACDGVSGWETLTRYEELYGDGFWHGTKPPGLQITFNLIHRALIPRAGASGAEACVRTLSQRLALLAPLLASLVAIPYLYAGARFWQRSRVVSQGLLVYFLSPAFTQFPLFQDQFLFPLLFGAILFMAFVAQRRDSLGLASATGVGAYLTTFVSFSLVPLLLLVPAMLAIHAVIEHGAWRRALTKPAAFAAGMTGAHILMRTVTGYDAVARFLNAMEQHRQIKEFEQVSSELVSSTLLNGIEFSLLLGPAVAILFAAASLWAVLRALRGQSWHAASIHLALLVTIAALVIFGQTKGEVGRLWLFLMPIISVLAIDFFTRYREGSPSVGHFIGSMQVITSVAVLVFMDYGCGLCS